MATKFYSRSAHIDAVPAFGKYCLVVRDSVHEHQNEPQDCYRVNGIWQHVSSRLEDALGEVVTAPELFVLYDYAVLACNIADKPTIDLLLKRYTNNHPRRPVSKSA